jgi:hypothetical protein
MFGFWGRFAVVVAFFLITSQSIKAALANPVDSLKANNQPLIFPPLLAMVL